MTSPILNTAVKAARRAGRTIVRHLDRLDRVAVELKGPGDFVSEVDRMAEDDIINIIRARYPNHRIVAEESGGELRTDSAGPDDPADGEVEWIIDPLDGTTNYLHGHPQFAVSIAARQHRRLQHGVVFDPLRDEMYTASRGQGAYLNERRIRVTRQDKLERALLATGFAGRHGRPGRRARLESELGVLSALLARVGDIRRCGSAALDLAFVACGRLDGYWETGLNAWDLAAGGLLVREAGGLVADLSGGQQFLESGEIIAANALIFNDLLMTVGAPPATGGGTTGTLNAPK